jgi:PAS domain S-box-containing protein
MSLISFFFFICYFFSAFYSLKLGLKNNTHLALFLSSIALAIWSFGYTFMFSAPSKEAVWFWYRFTVLGWTTSQAILIHFVWALSGRLEKTPHKYLVILFYIPMMVLAYFGIFDTLMVHNFEPAVYGWSEKIDFSAPKTIAFSILNLGYSVYALIALGIWAGQEKTIKSKKQFYTILLCSSVAIISVPFFNIFLPGLGVHTVPPIGHIMIGFWFLGLWIAILKYKFLEITPEVVVDEIISQMQDFLILSDSGGKIIKVNDATLTLLGYKENEILGKTFDGLIYEKDILSDIIREVDKNLVSVSKKLNFLTKAGEKIPFNINLSIYKDKIGDRMGMIIVAQDLREMIKLEEEVSYRRKIEKKLLDTNTELEEERNKLRARNEAMEFELVIARKIQMSLIPTKSRYPNIAFYYKPMDKVGGDFFDFIDFKTARSDKIGIFLSDVSGHGVPAAFVTSMVKSFTLQFAEIIDNPAEFIIQLNEFLFNKTGGNFITAFYGIFTPSNGDLVYANAGHNAPFIIKKSGYEMLESKNTGIPLGVHENKVMNELQIGYSNEHIVLNKGEKLLLYTDGFTETVNINEKRENPNGNLADFESAYLEKAISKYKVLPSSRFVLRLVEKLVDFRGSSEFDDDVCLICLDV